MANYVKAAITVRGAVSYLIEELMAGLLNAAGLDMCFDAQVALMVC